MKKAKSIIEVKYKERLKEIENQINKHTEEAKKNKEKQLENQEKIEELKKEKEEIISGELFQKASKIDKNSENIEENRQ
jgi:hypothetical protein